MGHPAKAWPDAVRYGFGPLMNVLFVRQRLLLALFEGKQQERIPFDVCGQRLHLRLARQRRQDRVVMDDDMNAWATSDQRTVAELTELHNAIRSAIKLPPYDPGKEPWTPMRS